MSSTYDHPSRRLQTEGIFRRALGASDDSPLGGTQPASHGRGLHGHDGSYESRTEPTLDDRAMQPDAEAPEPSFSSSSPASPSSHSYSSSSLPPVPPPQDDDPLPPVGRRDPLHVLRWAIGSTLTVAVSIAIGVLLLLPGATLQFTDASRLSGWLPTWTTDALARLSGKTFVRHDTPPLAGLTVSEPSSHGSIAGEPAMRSGPSAAQNLADTSPSRGVDTGAAQSASPAPASTSASTSASTPASTPASTLTSTSASVSGQIAPTTPEIPATPATTAAAAVPASPPAPSRIATNPIESPLAARERNTSRSKTRDAVSGESAPTYAAAPSIASPKPATPSAAQPKPGGKMLAKTDSGPTHRPTTSVDKRTGKPPLAKKLVASKLAKAHGAPALRAGQRDEQAIRASSPRSVFVQYVSLRTKADAQAWLARHRGLARTRVVAVKTPGKGLQYAVVSGPFASRKDANAFAAKDGVTSAPWFRPQPSLRAALPAERQ